MFGLLPDLTPRDSHSVWYTSSRNPHQPPFADHSSSSSANGPHHQDHAAQQSSSRRAGQLLLERSPLARLRADEQNLERRRLNVRNFGSTWLRPPGVTKTLHQMREERREAEEHAEAMRREALQQELAEAEEGGNDGEEVEDTGDMDDMGDGARDLDEEIPDADAVGMELSAIGGSSTDSASDSDSDSDGGEEGGEGGEALREERRAELVQARMRMARGGDDVYGADEEELEAETEGQLLLEDEGDSFLPHHGQAADDDLDMDADLDGSIPEAGELSGVYEHTDTEAELSSSLSSGSSSDGGDDDDVGFAPRSSLGAGMLRPPTSPTMQGRGQGHGRPDMDLSSLLSGGDSSVLGSSPQVRDAPRR